MASYTKPHVAAWRQTAPPPDPTAHHGSYELGQMYSIVPYDAIVSALKLNLSVIAMRRTFLDNTIELALPCTSNLAHSTLPQMTTHDVRFGTDGFPEYLFVSASFASNAVTLRSAIGSMANGALDVRALQNNIIEKTKVFALTCDELKEEDLYGSVIHCSVLAEKYGDEFRMPRYMWVSPTVTAKLKSITMLTLMQHLAYRMNFEGCDNPSDFCTELGIHTRTQLTAFLLRVVHELQSNTEATATATDDGPSADGNGMQGLMGLLGMFQGGAGGTSGAVDPSTLFRGLSAPGGVEESKVTPGDTTADVAGQQGMENADAMFAAAEEEIRVAEAAAAAADFDMPPLEMDGA